SRHGRAADRSRSRRQKTAQRAPQNTARLLRLAGRMGRTTVRMGEAVSFWCRARLQQRSARAFTNARGVEAKFRWRYPSDLRSMVDTAQHSRRGCDTDATKLRRRAAVS